MNLLPNFLKGGGLDRTLIFRGRVGEKEGGDLFEGVCNLYVKNKLKSEIFNDKEY